MMCMHIIFELLLDGNNIGIILYHFLLSVSHDFIALNFSLDGIDAFLDGLAILFEIL